ncbi:MAG: DeoR/GlpR family DNA-binding transcription regulator, partial [Kineothrix sp.]|nr:DeoR/GlpR family DNA-binding transcription regulator [Kineothrix sp.]
MLTEKRHEQILKLLEERGSITVTEAKDILGTSDSTVRRDITVLAREGKLVKVFGGAVALSQSAVTAYEYTVAQKQDLNSEEKKMIARYAASLIEPEDFIYLDAGTTTAYMLDYIGEKNATFVTNAVAHAQRLVSMKKKVLLIGGELKATTEAVVGSQAIRTIQG